MLRLVMPALDHDTLREVTIGRTTPFQVAGCEHELPACQVPSVVPDTSHAGTE